MKANRSSRVGLREDDGVSNVLGAIMFFALLITVFVTVRTQFVPEWEEGTEAARYTTLQGQLSQLKAEADQQANNRTANEVSQPLTIGVRSTGGFFATPPSPGRLQFTPNVADVSLYANEFRVLSENGILVGVINEEWTEAPATISDIGDVLHLRLRLDNPGDESAGDNLTVNVYDGDGEFAGSLSSYISRDPPDQFINTLVRNAQGDVLYDQGVFYHQVTDVKMWWTDALADELQFGDVLRAAEGPLTFEIEENGLTGEFAIVYYEEGVSGDVLVGGGGVTITDFDKDMSGGRLDIETFNQYYPAHHFHYENGAVILEQEEGALMRIRPNFHLDSAGSFTIVSMTVPALTGQADALSHTGTANVYLNGGSISQQLGSAPMWIYTVESGHPEVWADFFEEEAENAGLDASIGEYVVSSTATNATIEIYGHTMDPASTDHDLAIELSTSRVGIRIES